MKIKEIFSTALKNHKKNNFEVAENLYKQENYLVKLKIRQIGRIL